MIGATKGRGLAAPSVPSGDALLLAILDGAHETHQLRDGTVIVAFALDPDTADALFAFASDEAEDDDPAEDADASENGDGCEDADGDEYAATLILRG